MPPFRQKSDGSYYFKTHLGGVFSTWQVSSKGLDRLQRSGIIVGDPIPQRLVSELISLGWAYKLGTEISQRQLQQPFHASAERTSITLALQEIEESPAWQLVLLFPEGPRESLTDQDSASIQYALDPAYLSINEQCVAAMDLRSGLGGASYPVKPQEHSYRIVPTGRWPKYYPWLDTVAGLSELNTLFAGEEDAGRRLRTGELLIPGRTYYLVQNLSKWQASNATIPSVILWQHLSQQGTWQALTFQLPELVDEDIYEWCCTLGRQIANPPWRLNLVSPPPHRYLINSLPVIANTASVILTATPPADHFGTQTAPTLTIEHEDVPISRITLPTPLRLKPTVPLPAQFVSIIAQTGGTYRVYSREGGVAPLTFVVEPDPFADAASTIAAQPAPLIVTIDAAGQTHAVQAFAHPAPVDPAPLVVSPDTPITITAACPGPLVIRSLNRPTPWLHGPVAAHDLGSVIAPMLNSALTTDHEYHFMVDAGTFGKVYLHMVAAVPARPGWFAADLLPPSIVQRARWLALVIRATPRCAGHEVSLSDVTRMRLAPLRSDSVARSLTELRVVPRVFLPHLLALTQLLTVSASPTYTAKGPEDRS